MKLNKRFAALGLAAMMALGMGTLASAEDKYTDAKTVTITKNYMLEGEGVSPAEIFTITQTASKVTDGDAESAPALKGISDVTYTAGEATAAGTAKTFTVTLPTYEKTGVYEYTLKETAGTTAGVTYRDKTLKLVVTVVEENGLKRIAAVHTEDEKGEKSDAFSDNTYTANKLTVSKTVTGNLGDKTKEFKFTVKFTAPAGKDWTKAITLNKGNGATDLKWNDNTATFTLSDGDSVSFENVPAGVTYEVTEDDYTEDGYTTTKTGDTGTMDAEAKTAAFTNNKEKNVDTGISLDNMPYIMILAVVVVAIAAFVISRKRRVEF